MLRQLIRHIRLMLAGPALFEAAGQYASLTDWLDRHSGGTDGLCADAAVSFAEQAEDCVAAREQASQQLRGLLDRCAA